MMTKGWYHESRRHSLARRGIKTKKTVYYHATSNLSAPSIVKNKTFEKGTLVKNKNVALRYYKSFSNKLPSGGTVLRITTKKDYGDAVDINEPIKVLSVRELNPDFDDDGIPNSEDVRPFTPMPNRVKVKSSKVMGDYIALHGLVPQNELPFHLRHRIPNDEIWIREDVYKDKKRRNQILKNHEAYEVRLMETQGLTYKQAHKRAETHEKEMKINEK